MKVYRTQVYDDASELGVLYSWHASRADAERGLRRFQRERGYPSAGPEGVDAIEIPTDKRGLIGWLNTHFTRANG